MAVCSMIVFIGILQVSIISISLAGPTRKVIYSEDIGGLSNVWQYLDYEEPEFNESEGLTTDYFTDDYVGFYTEHNWPKAFLWDLADEGELPWAGMIIGDGKDVYDACGATLLTNNILMTVCACVRTIAYNLAESTDPLAGHPHILDQGMDISVVMETVEYHPETVYPKIIEAVATGLCMAWETTPETLKNVYKHVVEPAIFKFSPAIDEGVAVPWPPPPFAYDTADEEGAVYYTRMDAKSSGLYRFVSFAYSSLDVAVNTYDNFGREVNLPYRQIKVRETLTSQTECDYHRLFRELKARKWGFGHGAEERNAIICWSHDPSPPSHVLYQNWRDVSVPHYIKSVEGGLVGSPMEHKGQFAGWQLETLPYTKSFITSRGVDEYLIDYVNQHVPELAKGNRANVNDRLRPHFAIHDQKIFLPDPDLQEEEVDAVEWSLVGKSRFEQEFSSVDSISPGRKLFFTVSLVQILSGIM